MKPKVIVVLGPTASGKSSLGLTLAKRLDGEIVSADSMQIYRKMDIGTAKPSPEEQKAVRHHMIDICDPDETFTLAGFIDCAKRSVGDVIARGKTPILVGGTGLYISALTDNITLSESAHDEEYREKLKKIAEEQGGAALKEMLFKVDPESAKKLHDNDVKRLSRALEIVHETGRTKSEQDVLSRSVESPYSFYQIGLTYADRDVLYDRINRRVGAMFEQGLEKEVRSLVDNALLRPDTTAGQAIGYKEFFPYFAGETTLADVRETICRESRRYAKRQLTWFRRDPRINWTVLETGMTPEKENLITEEVTRFLEREIN